MTTRFSWTQPCCVHCWDLRNPGRVPVRLRRARSETCVYCSQLTKDGIYIRVDPALFFTFPTRLRD